MGDSGNIANAASTWLLDGVVVGVGAMIATKIDDAL